ncbi:DUF6884 domain-containing protein [Salipaludibacillus aurantiacus]|uniref:DUF6884 domain-containing protein n=1 Tax=Salipaludibacillus aurantiacus TaxID=1601833 RepID=A0A1H9VSD1_9BACI|nr:DUF6884 domain-containing protein [Salipaludibacillus aurantiacus]SES24404.1 hypothetical protein SAMN05518684_11253 [Salipaludibacillus aurantiacus]
MKELCVIPCGNKKIWDSEPLRKAARAKHAYTGVFHKLCKQYAVRFFEDYVILSAKHGFLRPDDWVPGPYDVSFSMRNSEVISPSALKQQFEEKSLDTYEQLVVLTGRKYVPVMESASGNRSILHFPLLKCKGIGYMQRELKKAVEDNRPFHSQSGQIGEDER